MEPIKTYKKENRIVKIYQDTNPESPREWDNLGVMVCWHSRYRLGDLRMKEPASYYFDSIKNIALKLPLYLYDHSGITISTTPFSCSWDSGQVGWIFVTWDKLKAEFGDIPEKELLEKAERILKGEVKTYDDYLTGNVYGFIEYEQSVCPCCHHIELKEIDSCWGFYEDGTIEEELGIDETWKEMQK